MKFKIGKREQKDLFISWITISIAFAIMFLMPALNISSIPFVLIVSLFAVGTGFILHELAHKYMAIKYGCHAEFRAWSQGLIFAIILPIITLGTVLFAAPGAVYIHGPHINNKQNGIISLAGPATNIILSILFFIIGFASANLLIKEVFIISAQINAFLGFFNLLPVFVLDGAKVFKWDIKVWLLAILIAGLLSFAPKLVFFFL